MKKLFLLLTISLFVVGCGKNKATEVCDCIDKNVSTKTNPEEASAALNECVKGVDPKEMDGTEKSEFNKKVSDCLLDSEKKNSVKLGFEIM